MKEIILPVILFTFIEISAQTTRPANIEIPITVFDNSGLPGNSRTLICGIDTMATDSIDALLGEYWILCPFASENKSDCPPVDHFEAVLDIPVEPDPNSFEFGSWKDFRYGTIPYSGIKTYHICYCKYGAATAVYISWDFPEGVTGLLQDCFGGLIFNYQMPDSGTYTNSYLIGLQGYNWGVSVILSYQNTIPVELISFSGFVESYNNVVLSWLTSTEINNKGFEVQRSKQSGAEWASIGFVEGNGTTIQIHSYNFTDINLNSGIYNYRLKQLDFNGEYKYSHILKVSVDGLTSFTLFQNYPNPFNPTTTIKYTIPPVASGFSLSKVTLKVYDVLGNEVATLVNEEKPEGSYELNWNAANLPSGVYSYQLRAGNFVQTKKMILLK